MNKTCLDDDDFDAALKSLSTTFSASELRSNESRLAITTRRPFSFSFGGDEVTAEKEVGGVAKIVSYEN